MYPPITPYETGFLDTGDGHSLYFERSGKKGGRPVVYLHGGPGAGCSEAARQFFDPAVFDVLLFDQRGCGKSLPTASVHNNTTAHLIADIEQLRVQTGVESWIVFGGSWGSTLGLAYAQAHPERVEHLALRGLFTGTDAELDWFFRAAEQFFPPLARELREAAGLPGEAADDAVITRYLQMLTGSDGAARDRAARAWFRYEMGMAFLKPRALPDAAGPATRMMLCLTTLETWYFQHRMFLQPDQLMRNMAKIAHIPADIVQGRYDLICPPVTAISVAEALPRAQLHMIEDAGHASFEPGIAAALVAAMDRLR